VNGLARKLSDTDFLNIINKHDIIILTETWISKNTNMNLEITGFESEHLHGNKSYNTNKGRYSGGVSIYFKSEFKNNIKIIEKNNCGISWIKICKSLFHENLDTFLCCVYIKPKCSKVIDASGIDLYEQIESDIEKYRSQGRIFITGDFNSRTGNEQEYICFDQHLDSNPDLETNSNIIERANKDKIVDAYGKRLLELCKNTNLLIGNGRLDKDKSIGEFTFINTNGTSTVDYLILDYKDFNSISKFEITSINEFSDHCGINFHIERKYTDTLAQSRDLNPASEVVIRWDESRVNEYRSILLDSSASLQRIVEEIDARTVDQSIENFSQHLKHAALNIFGSERKTFRNETPTKTFKRNKWFNSQCLESKLTFKKARNLFLRNKTLENKLNFLNYKREYNKIKKKTKKLYNRKEGDRISNLAKSNPKEFWKNIKKQFKRNTSNPDIHIDDMFNHFNSLYESNVVNYDINPPTNPVCDLDLDANFTDTEIRSAVFAQKNSKSAGTDNLISEIFKSSYDLISPFLLKLYNKIFSEGIYPDKWTEGIIIPIFKGGNPEPKNFRGITLNNIISKIYSKLLVTRLTKWAEKHDKIIDNQYGFQKKKSTVDCIFILHAIISKVLANKQKLYVAFLDWEKMFDKINRIYLWQKLFNENVSSKFSNALKAMYKTVKSFIKYNGESSDFITSNIGVKQGDPASSILCLFFLNDILNNINSNIDGIIEINNLKIFLLCFADDAVIFAKNPESLQSMLNDIENYCNIWNMKINVNKTKIMIFENGRHTNYNFFIYNSPIEIVSSFKYLGIHLFKNGNWNRTQRRIAQHASFALHNLFITCNQLDFKSSQKMKLFDLLVSPTLNYSAEVWGSHPAPDVEIVHKKFCRKILGVKKSSNVDTLYGELNRYPMSIQRKLIMIKYWIKLLSNNRNSLLFKAYDMLRSDADNSIHYKNNNWAFNIMNILYECGLGYVWQSQYDTIINYSLIKQRIMDIYQQNWYSHINNSRRLESYALFKNTFNFENYLDYIKEPKFRIALARFRTSSHDLAIETGRYLNTTHNERLCTQCETRMIENEYHFLLICPKFSELRAKYIKRYYYTWPTIQKFQNLMTNKSKTVTSKLSKFIYYANLKRS
jgi:hypothetical protein